MKRKRNHRHSPCYGDGQRSTTGVFWFPWHWRQREWPAIWQRISVLPDDWLLLEGGGISQCLPWCGIAFCGYLGKSVLSNCSTALSHTATFYTLRDLRKELLAKLSRVPMGTVLDTPSGQYKTTIVDRVEGMEPTLAHLIPEMTSNLLVPLSIAVYIFTLDWEAGTG